MGGLAPESGGGLDVHGDMRQLWPMDRLGGTSKASPWGFSFLAGDLEDLHHLMSLLFS